MPLAPQGSQSVSHENTLRTLHYRQGQNKDQAASAQNLVAQAVTAWHDLQNSAAKLNCKNGQTYVWQQFENIMPDSGEHFFCIYFA